MRGMYKLNLYSLGEASLLLLMCIWQRPGWSAYSIPFGYNDWLSDGHVTQTKEITFQGFYWNKWDRAVVCCCCSGTARLSKRNIVTPLLGRVMRKPTKLKEKHQVPDLRDWNQDPKPSKHRVPRVCLVSPLPTWKGRWLSGARSATCYI